MTLDPPTSGDRPPQEPFDFSLDLGGPLFQRLRRAHLSDDALTLVKKRILAFLLLTWRPLLGLSALGGQMLNGSSCLPDDSYVVRRQSHGRNGNPVERAGVRYGAEVGRR